MSKWAFVILILHSMAALAAPAKSATAVEIFGGLSLTDFDYREEMTPPDRSHENGAFTVFAGGLKISSLLMAGFGSFFMGNIEYASQVSTKYEGTVLSSSSGGPAAGSPAEATDYHNFLRLETHYYFGMHPNFMVHAGYGYRSWKRNLAYGSGYLETYTWTYLPLGIYIRNEISNFQYGVDLTYLVMLEGKIDIVFSENIVGGDDTTLTLGNRNGYRLAVPMSYTLDPQFTLQLKPWYEQTEIGKSDAKLNRTPSINGYIHEPASVTKQMGVYLGLSIRLM